MKKAEKRKLKEQDKGIVGFIMQQHFGKDLNIWINELEYPRNPSYISYTQADLVFMRILKNVCAQEKHAGNENIISENLKKLSF